MKRFLILILSLCLVACNSTSTPKTSNTNNTTVSKQTLSTDDIETKISKLTSKDVFTTTKLEEVDASILSLFNKNDYRYSGMSSDIIKESNGKYTITKDIEFSFEHNSKEGFRVSFMVLKGFGSDNLSVTIYFYNIKKYQAEYQTILKDFVSKLVVESKQKEILSAFEQETSLDYLLSYNYDSDYRMHINSNTTTSTTLDTINPQQLQNLSFHLPDYMNQLIHYQTASTNTAKVLTNHFKTIHTILEIPTEKLMTNYRHIRFIESSSSPDKPNFVALEEMTVSSQLIEGFSPSLTIDETGLIYSFFKPEDNQKEAVLKQINQIVADYSSDIQVQDLTEKVYEGKDAKLDVQLSAGDIYIRIIPNNRVLDYPKAQ